MKTVRGDKVERADEKMIMENGSRRRGAIKESRKRQRRAPKGRAKNRNEKMDIRLTQRKKGRKKMKEEKRVNEGINAVGRKNEREITAARKKSAGRDLTK